MNSPSRTRRSEQTAVSTRNPSVVGSAKPFVASTPTGVVGCRTSGTRNAAATSNRGRKRSSSSRAPPTLEKRTPPRSPSPTARSSSSRRPRRGPGRRAAQRAGPALPELRQLVVAGARDLRLRLPAEAVDTGRRHAQYGNVDAVLVPRLRAPAQTGRAISGKNGTGFHRHVDGAARPTRPGAGASDRPHTPRQSATGRMRARARPRAASALDRVAPIHILSSAPFCSCETMNGPSGTAGDARPDDQRRAARLAFRSGAPSPTRSASTVSRERTSAASTASAARAPSSSTASRSGRA